MLKFFTRLERTRNVVLIVFAVVMVASLVLFYAPSQNTVGANLGRSEETVAKVDGEKISVGEVVRQQESMSQYLRGQKMPAKSTLQQLIGSRIIRLEAARLGLTASDPEIASEIRSQTPEGKTFDQQIYEQNMISQYGTIAAGEESIRDEISAQKLNAFITAGVSVSEDEVLTEFQRKNTKFDVSYVSVNSADLSKTITPTDDELRAYFDANKQAYFIGVPQKKIRYIFVHTSRIGEKLQLAEADLRAEYDALPADKKIAGVLGQEIVLRVAKPDMEAEVMGKANEIVSDLRSKGDVTEEAFAVLARGRSENPQTASSGGKLRGPVREDLNKKDDPYQTLLKMKPGEVSEPITYQSRVFVLRRGEDVAKSFEDARKELEVSLRNRRAYAAAAELAQKVTDSLKQSKDVAKTAAEFASEANMSVADMIKETDYVKPGDTVPNIGNSPQFESGIEPLEAVGDIGEKTPIQNGFAIPMLSDRREPRDATFEEVKTQIVDIVKLEKANKQVEEIAKQIASGAANPGALAGLASGRGLIAKDQKDFILGSPLGEGPSASTSKVLEDAIYAMKTGDVSRTPIKVGDNWLVFGVSNRSEADMAQFATERSQLMEQMLSQKRQAVFGDYLSAIKNRLEAAGNVTIYKDVLEKLDAPIPGMPGETGMPGLPGGFPGQQ